MGTELKLDATYRAILNLLQQDARLSYAEIGRRVGLSTPAVSERVQKLEDAGIIKGYHAAVDWRQLGYGVQAFVRLQTTSARYDVLKKLLAARPEVLEVYHLAGVDSLMLKIMVGSIEDLERFVQVLHPYGETVTSIIMSTILDPRTPKG